MSLLLAKQQQLPQFVSPNNNPLYQLGYTTAIRAELQRQLDKFIDFSVTDATSDDHLRAIVIRIDSDDRYHGNLCLHMVGHWGNDDSDQLSQLMSLGVDPNVLTTKGGGYQPLHHCAYIGRWTSAQVLLDCRASRSAENINGETPLALARRYNQEAKHGIKPFVSIYIH
jgi:hypothetical protein